MRDPPAPAPPAQKAKEAKAARAEELERAGEHEAAKSVRKKDVDADQYTFMSTNPKVLASLDYGRGEYFEFDLYKRSAMSKRTIDLMRALLDAGDAPPASALPCARRIAARRDPIPCTAFVRQASRLIDSATYGRS